MFHAPSCHKIATSKSQGIIAPPEQQPSLQTVLDWMRSKLTNKLLPKMGRWFFGYLWRVGRTKLDFWLSLHLNCTKILATQTFWELWPQNCARPVIKKSESGQKLCKGWSQLREQASIFSEKLQLSICTLPFRFAPCRTHCCEKVSILRNEVIGKLWTSTRPSSTI